jgi:hypothetical protein
MKEFVPCPIQPLAIFRTIVGFQTEFLLTNHALVHFLSDIAALEADLESRIISSSTKLRLHIAAFRSLPPKLDIIFHFKRLGCICKPQAWIPRFIQEGVGGCPVAPVTSIFSCGDSAVTRRREERKVEERNVFAPRRLLGLGGAGNLVGISNLPERRVYEQRISLPTVISDHD